MVYTRNRLRLCCVVSESLASNRNIDDVLLVKMCEWRFIDAVLPDDVPNIDADAVDVRLRDFPGVRAVEVVERERRVCFTVLV